MIRRNFSRSKSSAGLDSDGGRKRRRAETEVAGVEPVTAVVPSEAVAADDLFEAAAADFSEAEGAVVEHFEAVDGVWPRLRH